MCIEGRIILDLGFGKWIWLYEYKQDHGSLSGYLKGVF